MQTRYSFGDRNRQSPNTAHVPSGRPIAAIRALLGISAEELADAAHLSPYSLSRLERDRRLVTMAEMAHLMTVVGGLMQSRDD